MTDLASAHPARRPPLSAIVRAVAAAAGISREELVDGRRWRDRVVARWAAMRIARGYGYSTPRIGRVLSRDHTTVVVGLRHCAGQIEAGHPDGVTAVAIEARARLLLAGSAPAAAAPVAAEPVPAETVAAPPSPPSTRPAAATAAPRLSARHVGARAVTGHGHVDRHGNIICNPW